jgi:RNA polymerase sigma factor (sigma-70 family)
MEPSHQSRMLAHHAVFERVVLPHLTDAHRLARSFTGKRADADDVVQEACLRLFRYAASYRGGNSRAWVLQVVRNTAFSWLRSNRRYNQIPLEDHEDGTPEPESFVAADGNRAADPLAIEEQRSDSRMLQSAMEALTEDQREVVMLRNLKGLAYREIAQQLRIPIGTVMSRLSRAHTVMEQRVKRSLIATAQ